MIGYDHENKDQDRERTELTDEAKDAVGANIDLLDYYFWLNHEIAGVPLQIRIGDQVVSWGDSTTSPWGRCCAAFTFSAPSTNPR